MEDYRKRLTADPKYMAPLVPRNDQQAKPSGTGFDAGLPTRVPSASGSSSLNARPKQTEVKNGRQVVFSDSEGAPGMVAGLPANLSRGPLKDSPFMGAQADARAALVDKPSNFQRIAMPVPKPYVGPPATIKPPGAPHQIPVPSNKPAPNPYNSFPAPTNPVAAVPMGQANTWGAFDRHEQPYLYDPYMGSQETEKALRELFTGTAVEGDEKGEEKEIDMEEATVKGFQEGIALLPHQVIGKLWMKERESGKMTGGILADDMGLGKTIQTLTRIVGGRPKKSDIEDGWAPPTLVVCPVALIRQWATEIQKMAVNLRVIEHHGASRTLDAKKLENCHVVITSYATVSSEYRVKNPEAKDESKKKSKAKSSGDDFISDSDDSDCAFVPKKKAVPKSKQKCALFGVKWWRIVLDEAHNIKNRNTKAAIGCCALDGKYRWCLTGTPMQNNVEELYSLFHFLRIKPLNDWNHFNTNINKPIKAGRASRPLKQLQLVLKAVMLRRTKDHVLNGKRIITLPGRKVEITHCEFSEAEQEFYSALEGKMESVLQKLMVQDKANYTSVLTMLLRLRQACNHIRLIDKDYKEDIDALDSKSAKSLDDQDDELAAMLGGLAVDKRFCQVCQMEMDSSAEKTMCSTCTRIRERASNLPPHSAKTRKIMELLRDIDDRDPTQKTIIFSQFTSMLDLIQPLLKEKGIKYCRYDGSMRQDQREKSLGEIRENKDTRVILISFKAGSTGLNLTACNNVILVDLWWNPALEDQAFDRAHRFGQTRDVNIYKLTIEKTVEERILELQEKKRALAAAALSGDKIKNMKLGMDDLLALFRPGGRDDSDVE